MVKHSQLRKYYKELTLWNKEVNSERRSGLDSGIAGESIAPLPRSIGFSKSEAEERFFISTEELRKIEREFAARQQPVLAQATRAVKIGSIRNAAAVA